MKTYFLEKQFKKNNQVYERIIEEKTYYVYKVTTTLSYGFYEHYEIIKRRVKKLTGNAKDCQKYKGYDSYEPYTSERDFGYYGWSTNAKCLGNVIARLKKEGKI